MIFHLSMILTMLAVLVILWGMEYHNGDEY